MTTTVEKNTKEPRDSLGYSVEDLRERVQEGIDSGRSARTMADVKTESRRRFATSRREERGKSK